MSLRAQAQLDSDALSKSKLYSILKVTGNSELELGYQCIQN